MLKKKKKNFPEITNLLEIKLNFKPRKLWKRIKFKRKQKSQTKKKTTTPQQSNVRPSQGTES